jgi:hypothetical protein
MKTYREIAEMHYGSDPNNKIDTEYKRSRILALEKLLSEQLNTSGVSDHRELLISFIDYLQENVFVHNYADKEDVDNFLKKNYSL